MAAVLPENPGIQVASANTSTMTGQETKNSLERKQQAD
jgi:hypothetical protein